MPQLLCWYTVQLFLYRHAVNMKEVMSTHPHVGNQLPHAPLASPQMAVVKLVTTSGKVQLSVNWMFALGLFVVLPMVDDPQLLTAGSGGGDGGGGTGGLGGGATDYHTGTRARCLTPLQSTPQKNQTSRQCGTSSWTALTNCSHTEAGKCACRCATRVLRVTLLPLENKSKHCPSTQAFSPSVMPSIHQSNEASHMRRPSSRAPGMSLGT